MITLLPKIFLLTLYSDQVRKLCIHPLISVHFLSRLNSQIVVSIIICICPLKYYCCQILIAFWEQIWAYFLSLNWNQFLSERKRYSESPYSRRGKLRPTRRLPTSGCSRASSRKSGPWCSGKQFYLVPKSKSWLFLFYLLFLLMNLRLFYKMQTANWQKILML